mgnify:CR=1 FL=1
MLVVCVGGCGVVVFRVGVFVCGWKGELVKFWWDVGGVL